MYGGTKSEMERLLKDAQKITGIEYDISKLSDVYSAIHAIQGELGITGTTAKEAGSTLEGSGKAAAAAWQNLLTQIVAGENIDEAIDNLAGTLSTAMENLMPAIQKGLKGIGTVIKKLGPVISKALPPLIKDVLPNLLSAASSLLQSLGEALPDMLGAVFDVAGAAIGSLWNTFIKKITGGNSGNAELFGNLLVIGERLKLVFTEISYALQSFLRGDISFGDLLTRIKKAFGNLVDTLISWVKLIDWSKVWTSFLDTMQNIGVWLKDSALNLADLFKKISGNIKTWIKETLIPWANDFDWTTFWNAVWDKFTNIKDWIVDKVFSLADLLNKIISGSKEQRDGDMKDAAEEFDWSVFWNAVWTNITNLGEYLKDSTFDIGVIIGKIEKAVAGLYGKVITAIKDALTPKEGEGMTADDFWTTVGATVEWFYSLGENFINGIVEGFTGQEFDLSDAIDKLVFKGAEKLDEFWTWLLGEDGETGIGWFNKVAQQFVDDLGEGFLNAVADVSTWFGNIKNAVRQFFTGDENSEGGLLGDIIGFVTGGFTTDWKEAWTGVVNAFGTVWSSIVGYIKKPINNVIGFINSMIDAVQNGVNSIISGINSALSISYDGLWLGWPWNRKVGAFSLSFDIDTVDWSGAHIPELAKGGVLSEGDAIFAEAGPEALSVRNGKAYVTPLSASSRTAAFDNAEIVELLQRYLPRLANMQVVLDNGTLVGEMNSGLGVQAAHSARYNA